MPAWNFKCGWRLWGSWVWLRTSTTESDGLGLQAKQTPGFREPPLHEDAAAHLGSNIIEFSSLFRNESPCEHQARPLLVCSQLPSSWKPRSSASWNHALQFRFVLLCFLIWRVRWVHCWKLQKLYKSEKEAVSTISRSLTSRGWPVYIRRVLCLDAESMFVQKSQLHLKRLIFSLRMMI